jgi:hypothetical protein
VTVGVVLPDGAVERVDQLIQPAISPNTSKHAVTTQAVPVCSSLNPSNFGGGGLPQLIKVNLEGRQQRPGRAPIALGQPATDSATATTSPPPGPLAVSRTRVRNQRRTTTAVRWL